MTATQPKVPQFRVGMHGGVWTVAVADRFGWTMAGTGDPLDDITVNDWKPLVRQDTEWVVLLREAQRALRKLALACVTVAPTLRKPYPDAPLTSPWDRFVHYPASEGYELAGKIRRLIGPRPKLPDDPWPLSEPPTGWRTAPTCDRCKGTGRTEESRPGVPFVGAHCGCKLGRRAHELFNEDRFDYLNDEPEHDDGSGQ
jgi:hypothetical protein